MCVKMIQCVNLSRSNREITIDNHSVKVLTLLNREITIDNYNVKVLTTKHLY